MKNISFIIVLVSIFAISCTNKYDRESERVSGSWKLSKFTYTNSIGENISITNSNSVLIFLNKKAEISSTTQKAGVVNFNGVSSIYLVYSFDFIGNKFEIDLGPEVTFQLPIDVIGKVKTYDFIIVNRNKLEFSTEKETLMNSNQEITNVKYTFEKI